MYHSVPDKCSTIINPRCMHRRVTVIVLCVCVRQSDSVTKLAATVTYTSFASPKCCVIRFLMAFRRHELCGFLR